MDPSAWKWHDWAKDEAQSNGKKVDNVRSLPVAPLLSNPPSPKAVQQQQPLTTTITTSNKAMCIKPTQEELQKLMPDPMRCFCDEEAHLLHLEEVGAVYVCYRFANPQDPVMCGFHMHLDGWQHFRKELENGLPLTLDHNSLDACKHFNFCFCSYFFAVNPYPKLLDNGPKCFCNRPLVDNHIRTPSGALEFTLHCENKFSTQKRCHFQIPARSAIFMKSTCHPMDKKDKRTKINAQDLLSALLDNQYAQKLDFWDDNKDTYSSGESSLSPKSQTPTISPILSHRHPSTCNGISKMKHKQTSNVPSPISTPVTTPPTTCITEPSPPPLLTQPLELYEIRQRELELEQKSQQQNDEVPLLNSIAPLSPPSLSDILSRKEEIEVEEEEEVDEHWEIEKHQLKVEIDRIQQEIALQDRNIESISTQYNQDKLQQALYQHQNENEHLLFQLRKLDSQRTRRQNRLAMLELSLAKEKEKESEENDEKTRPKGEDFKCKLCFNRYIEYALIPCYHLAYCEICADRLKECAICRKPVTTKIKIIMC